MLSLYIWNFQGPQNRHGILGGLIFGPRIFWVSLEALGIFLSLDFWLHSIIPVTWNPEYPRLGVYSLKCFLVSKPPVYSRLPFPRPHQKVN